MKDPIGRVVIKQRVSIGKKRDFINSKLWQIKSPPTKLNGIINPCYALGHLPSRVYVSPEDVKSGAGLSLLQAVQMLPCGPFFFFFFFLVCPWPFHTACRVLVHCKFQCFFFFFFFFQIPQVGALARILSIN